MASENIKNLKQLGVIRAGTRFPKWTLIILLSAFVIIVLKDEFNPKEGRRFHQSQIIGNWTLNKYQVNYPTLQFFADSTSIFHSWGDTVFRFENFQVRGDTLVLRDFGGTSTINKIRVLNDSVLIFDNLLEYKSKQIYRKSFKNN